MEFAPWTGMWITMIWAGAVVFLIFCGLTVAVVREVTVCLNRIPTSTQVSSAGMTWPRVQVILSLKGLDPFLERCLARLAAQDYPHYQVTVVVDSASDPAWEQALAAQRTFGDDVIQLLVRTHRSTHCTRKLSNLLTAFDRLPADVEIVALCDGDAVVDAGWLRQLVNGLKDHDMAAVSGNRWYSPTTSGLAELSRLYWNALAIPATHQHRILWAGSLAIRRSIVDEPGFREAFSHGFADDTVIAAYLDRTGRAYEVLGSTYVVNAETTSIRGYWNFLVRQMLCVRLHHPRWRPLFWHAMTVGLAIVVLLPLLSLTSLASFSCGAAGLLLYGATLLMLTTAYEIRLRRAFQHLETLQVPVSWQRVAMALPALLFTAVFYPAATLAAALTRRHLWRGVKYRLAGGRIIDAVDREPRLPLVHAASSSAPEPKFLQMGMSVSGLGGDAQSTPTLADGTAR